MTDPTEEKVTDVCERCLYWQDYTQRVFAMVAGVKTGIGRNILELRLCKYIAPPQVNGLPYDMYTDENHHCSGFKETPCPSQKTP